MKRTPRQRILDVLHPESGGARKYNVLAGLIGADIIDGVLRELRRARLIRVLYRNGGPHYSLTKKGLAR
jgi:hypothetical protein